MELLPQIEVDFIQEEPEQLKEEVESEEEDNIKAEVLEDIVPKVQEKEKNIIPEEDIFVEKKSKKAESDKPVKKKRQVSEAQLERLRLGREKALATRRAKAQEKKEIKELQDKKKKKELTKLRAEVNDEPEPTPTPKASPEPKPTRKSIMSLDDLPAEVLIQLQQKAIEGYDTKRKARKEQKRKEQNENQNNQYLSGLVQNAVNPARPPARYGEAGFFNDCF